MAESKIHDYIAGAIAGGSGMIVGHPIDTVKVQLQTQRVERQVMSLLGTAKHVYNQGMSRGLFRGLSWPLLSYGLLNSVIFGIYGNSLKILQGSAANPTLVQVFAAGTISGIIQLIPACPIDLVKVILQSQIPRDETLGGQQKSGQLHRYYNGPLECARDLVKRNGVRGLYKGIGAMTIRDLTAQGPYFVIYVYVSNYIKRLDPDRDYSYIASFIGGGLAGLITWAVVIPLDLVKSRLQADCSKQYKGIWDCVVQSVRSDGVSSMFRGAKAICIRAFIVNAVTFVGYEQALKFLKLSD